MLMRIWTDTLLVLAGLMFCVWLFSLCREMDVRPMREIRQFFAKQSMMGRIVFGALFLVMWIYASVKPGNGNGDGGGDGGTNNVQTVVQPGSTTLGHYMLTDGEIALDGITSGMADSPAATQQHQVQGDASGFETITSTNTTRTLTAEDFARGFVMTRIGTNEKWDFSVPTNATVCSDWRAFGAAEDWIYLAFTNWEMSLGTNAVNALRVFSFGKVVPFVLGEGGEATTNNWFAPFLASIGIVPESNWQYLSEMNRPSQFWHTITERDSLLLTWQNVLFNRDSEKPVSFQVELYPGGRFEYRYDFSRLSAEVLSNYLSGVSYTGNTWTTNTLPTNATSMAFHALALKDATELDKDGDGLATIDEIFVYSTDPALADTDYDGLSDPDELSAGTDPWNPDTDGDGLPDGDEVALGTNPLVRDSDGDSIGDWDEVYTYGTNPLMFDSDGDGLGDATEIAGTTDPTEADTDGDGLDDAAELLHETDPLNADMDGDGAPDGWEIDNGSNPFVADTDGDGLSDGLEMTIGSSPLLADTDGDGFTDFEEFVETGTSPSLADTDGDGISDWLEMDVMRMMPSNGWVSVSAESNVVVFAVESDTLDDAIVTTNLPFMVDMCGIGFDKISIDTNGKVHLIPTNGTPVTEYDYGNDNLDSIRLNGNDIIIAPYWDDLMLRPHLGSSICVGSGVSNDCIVVSYDNVGCYGGLDTNASLTCQIAIGGDSNFPVRINYQSVSMNMTGESATIGLFDRRICDYRKPSRCRSLVWSYETENAITNGLSLGFRFGIGTNPLEADTDGDGLDDGEEIELGTDPFNPDTDGDGLEDGAEVASGANPFIADTDGDGMPDAWEVRYGLRPNYRYDASTDTDHDGLTNLMECQIGSSPISTDTDEDGRSDYAEYNYGTSPILADTDGDGLDDNDEYQRGTSGTNPDTDNDGLPDKWEVDFNLNPINSSGIYGASGDPDSDGLTNIEEFRIGTNPLRRDTDGDGLDDGEEVGCLRWRVTNECDWASTMNGWTAVDIEYDEIPEDNPDYEPWPIHWFSFDEFLKIGDEYAYDVYCQWNGLVLVNSTLHYMDDLVYSQPQNMSGEYVSTAALTIAPCWTVSLTNDAPASISVFKRISGTDVRYAIQYEGLPVGGTNTVTFQSTLVFTNGVYKATEITYGDETVDGINGFNASVGVQDAVNGVKQSVGFNQYVQISPVRTIQFIPGAGTDPRSAVVDTDGDGLSDELENSIGTDPNQPDTDGDGMHDGWEYRYGLNPLVNNNDTDVDSDLTNDSGYDADGDGLTNQEEADWGTNPHEEDSDGDGVTDGQEVENSSDPADATDGGRPASRVPVAFIFGDPSGSHSEKYKLVIRPKKNPNGVTPASGEEPKMFEWVNAEYGECETKTAMLLRGWTYEVQLYHAGTNPDYDGSPRPDYDYHLSCHPPSCVGVVTNDSQRLFGDNTNSGDTFEADGKIAEILVLDGCLVGDYDSKDGITNYDLSRVYRNRPLRHWINDDDDNGDVNEGDEDIPGQIDPSWWNPMQYMNGIGGKVPDYYNGKVDGRCDILDFTPVWVDMGRALAQLEREGIDIELTLSNSDGAINIVWTSLATNNVATFLETDVGNCGKSLSDELESAGTVHVGEGELVLPKRFVSAMRKDSSKGIVLLEGRAVEDIRISTAPLVLCGYRKPRGDDDPPLFTLSLPLSISPVEDMFRWVDERWVCGDTNCVPNRLGSPINNPDSECDGRHFVFVHGYDVNAQRARGWAAEMFKRLWQSGSRSMFTAVDWFGNDSEIPGWVPKYGGEAPNYYANVEHAFATATQFVTDCANLPGRKIILAHSLGNMLVSSAAKDHGLQYAKYYMLNAAVPMEAYDGGAYAAAMIDHDWRGVTNIVFSASWHKLFNGNDGRKTLTWQNRFLGIGNAVNCYSASEDTLGNAGIDEWLYGKRTGKKFWAIQEAFKGTEYVDIAPGSLGLVCEGGWGYNPHYATNSWYVTWPNRRMTSRVWKRIEKLSKNDIIQHPVFLPFCETWLFTTNAISQEAIAPIRTRILSDGIPATSFAAGANALMSNWSNLNLDYSTFKSDTWPRRDGSWRHSDIKNVAYFFNYKFFKRLVRGENQ